VRYVDDASTLRTGAGGTCVVSGATLRTGWAVVGERGPWVRSSSKWWIASWSVLVIDSGLLVFRCVNAWRSCCVASMMISVVVRIGKVTVLGSQVTVSEIRSLCVDHTHAW
jgi:hypothetical protein